jgi:hypothetical protein
MFFQAHWILITSGISFLSFAVLSGLWVHLDSQRSPTKTVGRYIMQLHLFCLLFGILLFSLTNVLPFTAYENSTRRLISISLVSGGLCFAIRTFILAITRNPNVYLRPNALASVLGSLFVLLTGVSIFALLGGIISAMFKG